MSEISFEITDDEVDRGYSASALGNGIHTQSDSVQEIRSSCQESRRLLLRRHHAAIKHPEERCSAPPMTVKELLRELDL